MNKDRHSIRAGAQAMQYAQCGISTLIGLTWLYSLRLGKSTRCWCIRLPPPILTFILVAKNAIPIAASRTLYSYTRSCHQDFSRGERCKRKRLRTIAERLTRPHKGFGANPASCSLLGLKQANLCLRQKVLRAPFAAPEPISMSVCGGHAP